MTRNYFCFFPLPQFSKRKNKFQELSVDGFNCFVFRILSNKELGDTYLAILPSLLGMDASSFIR